MGSRGVRWLFLIWVPPALLLLAAVLQSLRAALALVPAAFFLLALLLRQLKRARAGSATNSHKSRIVSFVEVRVDEDENKEVTEDTDGVDAATTNMGVGSSHEKLASSRGYGLSTQMLERAGLSSNGRPLLKPRFQRRGSDPVQVPRRDSSDSQLSELSMTSSRTEGAVRQRGDGIVPCLRRHELSPSQRLRAATMTVSFHPQVSARLLPDITDLSHEEKSNFWWQRDDFSTFLKLRVQIAKIYKQVSKKLGVPGVDLIGVDHGHPGYKAMIEHMPDLTRESRRGLGLGRCRQRAKARVAYIQGVKAEQRRQWTELLGQGSDSDSEQRPKRTVEDVDVDDLRDLTIDVELLRLTAEQLSEDDCKYATYLGKMYYDIDRKDALLDKQSREVGYEKPQVAISDSQILCDPPSAGDTEAKDRGWAPSMASFMESWSVPQGDVEFLLSDITVRPSIVNLPSFVLSEDGTYVLSSSSQAVPGKLSSKGYGISNDKLKEFGLSPNGHALLRPRRREQNPSSAGDDGGCSDASDSEAEVMDSDNGKETVD